MQNKWVYALGILILIFLAFYFYRKYKVAPDIDISKLDVKQLSGESVDFNSLIGKKTLLCFGASWCGPCRKELKMIGLLKDTELAGINIVVISDEAPERVEDFKQMADAGFNWWRLQKPFSSLGINSIPTTYLVNTKGKIVKKTVGYIDWEDPSTAAHLKKLMN